MPAHHHLNDWHLTKKNLSNYWGYNTLSYFAPEVQYATSPSPQDVVREFKMMVRALHAANLEVILDVVYNHSAEGNHEGPTLSLRRHRQHLVLPGPAASTRASIRTSPAVATR